MNIFHTYLIECFYFDRIERRLVGELNPMSYFQFLVMNGFHEEAQGYSDCFDELVYNAALV